MRKNILIFIELLLISGIVSCMLGVDYTWDLYSYHYYNAFAVLNNKIGFDLMPAGIQSYLNPIIDIIDYYIINIFRDNQNLVLFLLGLPYGCLTFVLYLINQKLFNNISKDSIINKALIIFATIISATECFIISEVGTAFHDINIAIFILLMLFFILNYIQTEKIKNMCFAGFFAGIACGLKLTAVPYLFALLITFLILNIKTNFKKLLYNIFVFILFSLFGFFIVNGYWMYILWQKFQNPVFPMFNGIFKSEWFTYVDYHDTRFNNTTIFKILFYPLIWSNIEPNNVAELKFFDFRHSFAYICILFSFIRFVIKSRLENISTNFDKQCIFICIFTLISYLLWIKTFGILRYFIPILSLSGTIVIIFISQVKFLINNKRLLLIILSIFIVLSFIKYEIPAWGRSENLIYTPKLPIKKNSVVFIYGKPLGFYAAKNYENTRFIYLFDNIDGQNKDFTPSKRYYDYVDALIKNKKKYIIMTNYEYEQNDEFHNFIKRKYINSNLKCKTIKLYYSTSFDFCEYLD